MDPTSVPDCGTVSEGLRLVHGTLVPKLNCCKKLQNNQLQIDFNIPAVKSMFSYTEWMSRFFPPLENNSTSNTTFLC